MTYSQIGLLACIAGTLSSVWGGETKPVQLQPGTQRQRAENRRAYDHYLTSNRWDLGPDTELFWDEESLGKGKEALKKAELSLARRGELVRVDMPEEPERTDDPTSDPVFETQPFFDRSLLLYKWAIRGVVVDFFHGSKTLDIHSLACLEPLCEPFGPAPRAVKYDPAHFETISWVFDGQRLLGEKATLQAMNSVKWKIGSVLLMLHPPVPGPHISLLRPVL